VVEETEATVATIDPNYPDEYEDDVDAWRFDVVHRWAHVMEEQQANTRRRYSAKRHRLWTPRRR
jgi:hypothetical protein